MLLGYCQEGDIRLGSLGNSRIGHVEICVGLTWTTVCEDSWDSDDASVACHQLGYSRYGQFISYFLFDRLMSLFHDIRLCDILHDKFVLTCGI